MIRRGILPASLLIAALVAYLRIAGSEPEPVAGSYADLVKATQPPVARRDAGERLTCAAAFTAPKPRAPEAPSDAGRLGTVSDWEKRQAELDTWPLERLLKEAKPGELDGAVLSLLLKRPNHTEAEGDLVLHWALEAEVNNGGFHQFFFNSTGNRALQTREAVRRIGPPTLLALYDCALTAFPGSKPSENRDARNAELASWGDEQFSVFDALDDTFYELSGTTEAREHYIRTQLAR